MLRYALAAAVFKAFSLSRGTKRVYRLVGNTAGAWRRARDRMPGFYLERVQRMLRLSRHYGAVRDGARLLEIGTGWLHWEALTAWLMFDVSGVLFDVWDNRQLPGLLNYAKQLRVALAGLDLSDAQRSRAEQRLSQVSGVASFDELYDLMGFVYVCEPSGRVDGLGKGGFDVVVSAGVLEHVPAGVAPDLVRSMATLLTPGGHSMHSINLRDHLTSFDGRVSVKQYMNYGNRAWRRWFDSGVQHINRIQRPQWRRYFDDAGFDLLEEEMEREHISGIVPASPYRNLDIEDIDCCGLRLLHRKPGP